MTLGTENRPGKKVLGRTCHPGSPKLHHSPMAMGSALECQRLERQQEHSEKDSGLQGVWWPCPFFES